MNIGFGRKRQLLAIVSALLFAGFAATTVIVYSASREALRASIIENELPAASDTLYTEIRRDLVTPVLVSSFMAGDTFLRDWIYAGESDVAAISRYLTEIKARHGAETAFFVSARTGKYYYHDGVLKTVDRSEPRDEWFFRVLGMSKPYEINVDPDMAHLDALTIFINYRVADPSGNALGATGVGITVRSVKGLIDKYRAKYGLIARFVDEAGVIVTDIEPEDLSAPKRLGDLPGLAVLASAALDRDGASFQYRDGDRTMLLVSSWIPELGWYLVVEKEELPLDPHMARALLIALLVCLCIVAAVLALTGFTVYRFQTKLEYAASTDGLTGLLNRQAFGVLREHVEREIRRDGSGACVIMGDLDFFKRVNDERGHAQGDLVLVKTGQAIRQSIRATDLACRWGGEEFLILLKGCHLEEAMKVAASVRSAVAESTQTHTRPGVTISLGVVELRADEGFEAAAERADRALYKAKRDGRDRAYSA
jgi:diguanylate cyclase (GGDEF)-like protein